MLGFGSDCNKKIVVIEKMGNLFWLDDKTGLPRWIRSRPVLVEILGSCYSIVSSSQGRLAAGTA